MELIYSNPRYYRIERTDLSEAISIICDCMEAIRDIQANGATTEQADEFVLKIGRRLQPLCTVATKAELSDMGYNVVDKKKPDLTG